MRRGGIRTQPQIDAKDITVRRALLQELHQPARHAHIKLPGVRILTHGCRVGIEEDDEIDVAGIIQLKGAHLAHGDHDIARALLRLRRIARLQLAALNRIAEKEAHRRAHRRVGKIGQGAGDLLQRPDPADVGERNQQCRLGLHVAEEPHRFLFLARGVHGVETAGQDGGQILFGIGRKDGTNPGWIGADQVPEIRRTLGYPFNQGPDLGISGEERLKPVCKVAGDQPGRRFRRGNLGRRDHPLRQ